MLAWTGFEKCQTLVDTYEYLKSRMTCRGYRKLNNFHKIYLQNLKYMRHCTGHFMWSVDRFSVVFIVTRYGLDGPGIESLWRRLFLTSPDLPEGPPSFLYNGYRVCPGVKAAGVWCWPPTPSSAEVKERVELYLYSTYWISWPVIGWTWPLHLLLILQTRSYRLKTLGVALVRLSQERWT
jgi:hypothetical protein